MLHIVLLESALELVPTDIVGTRQVRASARRRGRRPDQMLLDQSYHGQAMLRLRDHERRGRPDIVFLSLLSLLETPLCRAGLLSVHLHLRDGRVVDVDPTVRLPRNYERFTGLLEQLLLNGRVPPTGTSLLQVTQKTLTETLDALDPDGQHALRILADEDGQPMSMHSLCNFLPDDPSRPVIVGIGAFPHGDLSARIRPLFQHHVCLDNEVMMAWHVCSEVLWAYSLRVGLGDSYRPLSSDKQQP